MRISEAQTTAKKTLVMNDIAGVDLTSAPLGVDANRASYMKNMINKGGVNYKRNGFVQAAQFFDQNGQCQKINGIYPLSMGEHFAVHTGTELRKCNSDFSFVESMLEDGAELADKKSQGFYANGTLYLVCGERLYYYDAKKEDGKLLPLFNSDKAYVPTTSIGITDTEHGSLLEEFEDVNLFSTKRINKLTGTRNEEKTEVIADGSPVKMYSSSLSEAKFILDGEIDTTKGMVIYANYYLGGLGSEKETELPCRTDNKASNVRIETRFEVDVYEARCYGTSNAIYKNGEKVEIKNFETELSEFDKEDDENPFVPSVFVKNEENEDGQSHGVITFTPALPSPLLGEDNITVEYYVKKDEPKIKYACEFAVSAKEKQIAIVTEDDVVYYSSPAHGWGYFPDKSYVKVISDITSISEGESALIVSSKRESAVISFNLSENSKGINLVPKMSAKYPDVGSISPYASVNLEGDALILTKKGVYGVNAWGAYVRSTAINKELLSFSESDFENAIAVQLDRRYYLFIGGVVYIADARYKVKFLEGERLASSYEYEWWRWEVNEPTSCLCYNDKMYLGKSDGRVLELGDGYADREILKLKDGDVIASETDKETSFTFEKSIDLTDTKIEIGDVYKKMNNVAEGTITNASTELLLMRVTYDEKSFFEIIGKNYLYPSTDTDTCAVYVCVKTNEYHYDLKFEGHIFSIEYDKCSVNITVPEDNIKQVCRAGEELVRVYPKVKCEVYSLDYDAESGDYKLIDRAGEAVTFYKWGEMTAKLVYDKPVECEIHTAIFNLGSDIKKKVLHELCFVPGITTTGEVSIGFETNKNGDLQSVGVGGTIISTPSVATELDIGGLDFNNFTFDSAFVRTFRKRLHERGVEFVKFKLASKTADDFSIERLSCVYSYYSR